MSKYDDIYDAENIMITGTASGEHRPYIKVKRKLLGLFRVEELVPWKVCEECRWMRTAKSGTEYCVHPQLNVVALVTKEPKKEYVGGVSSMCTCLRDGGACGQRAEYWEAK